MHVAVVFCCYTSQNCTQNENEMKVCNIIYSLGCRLLNLFMTLCCGVCPPFPFNVTTYLELTFNNDRGWLEYSPTSNDEYDQEMPQLHTAYQPMAP